MSGSPWLSSGPTPVELNELLFGKSRRRPLTSISIAHCRHAQPIERR